MVRILKYKYYNLKMIPMAIVIKEIHVCTTIEKDRQPTPEMTAETIERLREFVENEIVRFRLEENGKRER